MTPRRWLIAASALLALLAAGLLAAAGSGDGSGEAPGAAAAPAVPADGSADAGFARDMAVHHQQAVEMAFLVRDRTEDEEIRLLAYDIIATQSNQRGMLLGWLDLWNLPVASGTPMAWMAGEDHGHGADAPEGGAPAMPGMATDAQLDGLRGATGRDAERRFLRLMTAHHRGGVDMARAAARLAGTEEVRRLAQGMADSQEAEISLMNALLAERGA
ncbi:DUF305 domain-containing protein [Streptomyces sp. DSM 44917]|uniref:DUF305 domain-containing protein n=1 Tax=Streptomyces boetiae TaxID=3075541 RepID=A0ABU2L2R2_9ACTN|nr:DUF305 domain-containing protein [Streptomyces sp. DSM 44917]MDT0305852.1 DUF305 domain-containing protein [Streptomyces sp. DSM 44917]